MTKEMKDKVINGWLKANNALLYKAEENAPINLNKVKYIVSAPDEDIHITGFEKLYDEAVYNTLCAVQSLRKQGETDKEIEGYGFILPETIEKWNKIDLCARIDRYQLDDYTYLYRGRLYDGRWFYGKLKSGYGIIGNDYLIKSASPTELADEDYAEILQGNDRTEATIEELWLNTPAKQKHTYKISYVEV